MLELVNKYTTRGKELGKGVGWKCERKDDTENDNNDNDNSERNNSKKRRQCQQRQQHTS